MSDLKIKIKYRIYEPESYSEEEDCERIQRVLQDLNIEADIKTCASIWKEHSDHSAAGWLNLPEDDNDLKWIVRGTVCSLI